MLSRNGLDQSNKTFLQHFVISINQNFIEPANHTSNLHGTGTIHGSEILLSEHSTICYHMSPYANLFFFFLADLHMLSSGGCQ